MCEDLDRFVAWAQHGSWFEKGSPVHAARAPGRLDVMGGIADYSGSLVLQMPIAQAACCAAQYTDSGHFEAISIDVETGGARRFAAPIALLEHEPASIAEQLAACDDGDWAAYLLGPVAMLVGHAGAALPAGLRVLLRSEVPVGKGVSSSAAIELATARAAAAALACRVEPYDLALLCQQAENHVAGAPCGVMDQLASMLGEADHLLALRCQPAQVLGLHRVPETWRFWGIDSGVRHAVSGADYGSVRAAAFMGYRYIADAAGLAATTVAPAQVRIDDPYWHGYVANITPSEFETRFRNLVPERITGQAFLEQMHGATDRLVPIEPGTSYAPRQAVAHPIYEHHRVRLFAQLLSRTDEVEEHGRLLGELMYQSHASYSACGLGSEATDALVALVRQAGPEAGLYGARITGGGSGGTVAVLGRAHAEKKVREIARDYQRLTSREARLFAGSSPGAAAVAVKPFAPGGAKRTPPRDRPPASR